MNIRKYSLKTMCAALACTTILSSMFAAYATDVIINETPMDDSAESVSLMNDSVETETGNSGWTTEENRYEDIKVTYQQSASYAVIIPKTIALDTNKQAAYAVKVAGDIDTNQRVYVAPVDGIAETDDLDFYMKEKDNKKEDVVAKVTQNKNYWSSEDVANGHEAANNSISAPNLTAGTWEGTFQMEIRLEAEKAHTHNYVDGVCTGCGEKDPNAEHEHNYVDGKCECGAIDPNHEHNYEDGECTICGEKDSYEIAPAEAYSKWNYTLDNTNNIITLNYWNGSNYDTDVIVYANYVINGKTYKTQIKSNSASATYDTKYMFNNCRNVKSIKFSDAIDTSNVTNMRYMFGYCSKLMSLDLRCFDTSNVTNMNAMFRACSALESLDLSSFDTGKVTDMSLMFSQCSALNSLDVSNFDTGNVTDMNNMFNYCSALNSLDLSNFDTGKVTNMSGMFTGCTVLTSLDLSSFETGKVTDMSTMFYSCHDLNTVYVTEGKWLTSQAKTSNMFGNGSDVSSITYK